MTEKADDKDSRTSSSNAIHPLVDPPAHLLPDPLPRKLLSATPTQTTPLDSSSNDQQHQPSPPAKEGFNYWTHLPYEVEDEATRIAHLNDIIGDLYTYIRAGDFDGGARKASRQIKRWLHLKFKMPKETRKDLAKVYYELSLTPGIDPSAADCFANMFKLLASPRKVPTEELSLDWRPLYDDLYRYFIRVNADPPVNDSLGKSKDLNHLTRLARHAQKYFPAKEIPAILEKILPEFEAYFLTGAFNTIGLLTLLLPLQFPPEENPPRESLIQTYLPLMFSLWSQVSNSSQWNFLFIDLFGVIASRQLSSPHAKLGPYGIFTREQSIHTISCAFRLLGVPIGPVGAGAYSRDVLTPDHCTIVRYRGARTGDELCIGAARWIVYSLTNDIMDDVAGSGEMTSMWGMVESLLQSVETAFHPSNSGNWTPKLAALVYRLAEKFTHRWTQEQRGKRPDVPEERRLTPAVKRRFVLALRKVVFMSIYDKNSQASSLSRSTLAILAYLEPDLIIPGVLKRFYPSMHGLLEAHRTTASLASLTILMPTISRHKIYRNHVTTFLGLALPGIDPNDLSKTTLALTFMISTCMLIPLWDLSDEGDHTMVAHDWINSQMEILETMQGDDYPDRPDENGTLVSMDPVQSMTDAQAQAVARSSTGSLGEWVTSFFNQIFGFLANMPDQHKNAKTAEEVMVPMITLAVSTVLQALEPALYTLALGKMLRFVTENVFHNAGEATASICRCFVEVRPEEAMEAFMKPIMLSIREEIMENGAGKSGRITTTEVLPRDRTLLWHLRIFWALCGPRAGMTLVKYLEGEESVRQIIELTARECKGTMYYYIGKGLQNVLGTLTGIYVLPGPLVKKEKADLSDWAPLTDPENLNVKWHVPSEEETESAIAIYKMATEFQLGRIDKLLNDEQKRNLPDWTDELRQCLKYIVNALLASAALYHRLPRPDEWEVSREECSSATTEETTDDMDVDSPDVIMIEDEAGEEDDDDETDGDDEGAGRSKKYVDGYNNRPLMDEQAALLKSIYQRIGMVLLDLTRYLKNNRKDDYHAFIEISTTMFAWLHPQGMASMNDVRMEATSSAMFNIRRAAFVVKSLGKDYYPEAVLVQKMESMQRERVSHNTANKPSRTWWQDPLITQVVNMSINAYMDVRIAFQSILYLIVRRYKKWAPLVLPTLITALKSEDIDKVKGALHTLRIGTIEHTLARNWDYAPDYLLALFKAFENHDRPSVQNAALTGITSLGRYNKSKPWITNVDESVYESIRPDREIDEKAVATIRTRKEKTLATQKEKKSKLILDCVPIIDKGKWRLQVNVAGFVGITLVDRTKPLPDKVVALFLEKMNDSHPQMRSTAQARMMLYFRLLSNMGFARDMHDIYFRDTHFPNEVIVRPREGYLDGNPSAKPSTYDTFTEQYIAALNTPPNKDTIYHDHIKTGMFVWPEQFIGYKSPTKNLNEDFAPYVLEQIKFLAPIFNREWVHKQLEYLREETSKSGSGLRSPEAYVWPILFRVFRGLPGAITEDEIREEIIQLLDDGKQKFRHQATFEIVFSYVMSLKFASNEVVERAWEWLLPFLLKIFETMLKPDNVGFWRTFLTSVLAWRDPRQVWPLAQRLLEFRLDSSSHEFFQESSRALMLRVTIQQYGWRYSGAQEMFRSYMDSIIHPYQEVRKEVGIILSTMTSLNRSVSFNTVQDVIRASKEAPSTGFPGWLPSEDFEENMKVLAAKLEKWRNERVPGQTAESSPYVTGAQTILSWWQSVIIGTACMVMLPFVAKYILPETLHMMDVKEEVELMSSASSTLRYIGNAPFAPELIPGMVEAIEKIGMERRQWHHRLRILMVIQVFYYRQLFVLSKSDRKRLFDVVIVLLNDSQLEVREAASATLSGMVQCTKFDEKNLVLPLLQKFKTGILMNPMPKKRAPGGSGSGISTPQLNGLNTPPQSGFNTPDGLDNLRLNKDAETLIRRHAAVLGLSSIITAFPYEVPEWMPSTLAFLANKASGDRGMISMSVKKTLGDFKKTHQDTWLMDQKLFDEDELEALEGVFSSNYFA